MSFSPISLDQLTIFVAVVEHGTFSAAGRAVGRVQSAVSHAVAALEGQLGVTLFDRSGRVPKLTDAGRRLLGEARLVLSQVRALQQQAEELRGGVEPEVDLVVDTLFPHERLVAALGAFHRAFPLVTVNLQRALLDDATRLVRDGAVDFGICNVVGASEPLVVRPMTEIRLIPVCAPSHPLADLAPPQATDALRKATQILLAERERDRTADQAVLSARTWRVGDLQTKLALLLDGVGWGNMPRSMVEGAIATGRLIRLEPEPWPASGHLVRLARVVRPDRPLGPAARWLSDELERVGAEGRDDVI